MRDTDTTAGKARERNAGSFLRGTFILSAAGITSKVVGAGAKVALVRFILGAEGIGLYQMAYPIYTIILTVSHSGIPVALSKMIAGEIALDNLRKTRTVFRVALLISLLTGTLLSLFLLLASNRIAGMLGDPRSFYALLALSPAVVLVTLMATFRGFFQGQQMMLPTAVSQIVEQLVRVFVMLGLGYILIDRGLEFAAAGATFGAAAGAFFGLIVLLIIFFAGRNRGFLYVRIWNGRALGWREWKRVASEIFRIALPVSFGVLVLPLMRVVDAFIVPRRLLLAGYPVSEATALFGDFAGMAMVLVDFPTIITVALAASLVPAVSEAFSAGDTQTLRRRSRKALRFALFIGLPAAFGLSALAEPVCSLLFGRPQAAVPLQIVAFGVVFIGLYQTSAGILQGMGLTVIPAVNLLYGAGANAVINYLLTAVPAINIRGAALGTLAGFALASSLNLWALKVRMRLSLAVGMVVLKPILASLAMVALLSLVYSSVYGLSRSLLAATVAAIATGMFVYVVLMLVTGAVRKDEVVLIPAIGYRMASFIERLGLFGR